MIVFAIESIVRAILPIVVVLAVPVITKEFAIPFWSKYLKRISSST